MCSTSINDFHFREKKKLLNFVFVKTEIYHKNAALINERLDEFGAKLEHSIRIAMA